MKYFFLVSLMAIVSCGKIEMPTDSKLGEALKLDQRFILSGSEFTAFKGICDAITRRELAIVDLINTPYTFGGTTKNCTDTGFAPVADANVLFVSQGGSYKFNEGAVAYYFSEVETANSGDLSLICNNISNLVSPITSNNMNYIHFTADSSSIAASDCPRVANEQCVKIEKGVKKNIDDKEVSVVHTRDWIRVRLDKPGQSLIGYWSYKKRISEASCADNYFIGRTATLK